MGHLLEFPFTRLKRTFHLFLRPDISFATDIL